MGRIDTVRFTVTDIRYSIRLRRGCGVIATGGGKILYFIFEKRRLSDMKNILLLVRLQHSVHHLTYSCDILHLQTLYEYFCFLPVTIMATLQNLKFIWAATEVYLFHLQLLQSQLFIPAC
jgi:hypothetical protein